MTPTEEERKAAMEWFEELGRTPAESDEVIQHYRTLKAMLAEPRLPVEPDDAAIRAMYADERFGKLPTRHWINAYRALYAHLTKPVEKWGVCAGMGWVHFESLDDALAAAKVELAGGEEVQIKRRRVS